MSEDFDATPGAGRPRRVGVFGGAFDPPHQAHVALARAAIEQLNLDELRVVPTGDAWHKSRTLSPAADRLKMAELAFAGFPQVCVDDREIQRSGPSYTLDTLEALRAEKPGAEFFLLMGGDQWASFSSWHRWRDILQLACAVVAARPPTTDGHSVLAVPASWPDAARVLWLDVPSMPVSATAIRQKLSSFNLNTPAQAPSNALSDPALAGVLPEAVARYISLHGLYQARDSI